MLAGWLIVFFPVLACVLLFLLRVLVWLVRLRLIRLCRVVFAFALACWLRLWLLLWLGLVSRPVFDACGCFVLAVLSVAVSVFRSCPALSVVCVAKIPLVCSRDWLSAFGADVCFTCGQSYLPCPAEVAVCCVVSSCCRAATLLVVCVGMGVAEPLPLWHELRAIVPGASTKAHCEILQPLVVCVVLRAGVGPPWVECVVVIMVVCAVWRHGWFGVRPLVFVLFRLLCR